MALEIRELKIKGYIDKSKNNEEKGLSPRDIALLKKQIIKECKSEVIRYLEKQ